MGIGWRMPEQTAWAKKQNAHEPTRKYGEALHNLVRDHGQHWVPKNPIQALEIGAAWGVSALAILTANPSIHLTSVDPDINAKARAEVLANGLGGRHKMLLARSQDFWAFNKQKYDLIYIDGSHRYEDARPDLFAGWEALEPNGLLIADDITHPANNRVDKDGISVEYGVALAAWELIVAYGITEVKTAERLLCIRKQP